MGVSKRANANGYAEMITIGRGRNNDIWLPSLGVSKFHAYVTRGQTVACLVDAGSTTGTFYEGQRLRPHTRVPLRSGARVQIGDLEGFYLSREDFYDQRIVEA